jgi:DNA polymerase-3 subunit chi
VPHVVVHAERAERATQRLAPIWLLPGPLPQDHPGVLVNLGSDVEAIAARFQRLIEIVGDDPAAVESGRARWRHYRSRGWAIKHHVEVAAPRP